MRAQLNLNSPCAARWSAVGASGLFGFKSNEAGEMVA